MKKMLFISIFISLVQLATWSIEIEVGTIECLNNALECKDLYVKYNPDGDAYSNGDCIYIYYAHDYGTIAFSFDNDRRVEFLNAINKAIEWDKTAEENSITEMSKYVNDLGNYYEQVTFYNWGGNWEPSTTCINYMFFISEINGDVGSYLFLQYRSVDNVNNGEFGSALTFSMKQLFKLKSIMDEKSINEYQKLAEIEEKKKDLFN